MRILSLFPKKLYDTKMSAGRTMYLNYTGSQPGNSIVWSGNGWANYESDQSVSDNLKRLEVDGEFDALIVYKGGDLKGLKGCNRKVVIIFNEAHDDQTVNRELAESQASVAVFHHEGDFLHWKWNLGRRGIKAHNWCHACPELPKVPWDEREDTPILSGCTAKAIYPIRHNTLLAIQEGHLNGFHLTHPGYRLEGRVKVSFQYACYLKTLAHRKVSICCSSIYKYPLAKLFESAMAGCAVATDKPTCSMFEKRLWPHCIRLDSLWSPERIAGELSLYTDDELRERGSALQEAAIKHFSYKSWSDCLTSAVMDNR
jgi:hypothetical protein